MGCPQDRARDRGHRRWRLSLMLLIALIEAEGRLDLGEFND
jgi:hypothetical protein